MTYLIVVFCILITLIFLLIHVNLRLRELVTSLKCSRSSYYSQLKLDNTLLKRQIKSLTEVIK